MRKRIIQFVTPDQWCLLQIRKLGKLLLGLSVSGPFSWYKCQIWGLFFINFLTNLNFLNQ